MSHDGSPYLAGVLHRSVRKQEFQLSFLDPFRVIFLGTLLPLGGANLATTSRPEEFWLLCGLAPVLTALLAAVSVGLIVWRFKFTVGPEGIQCYDFWCRPLTTTWGQMQAVHAVRLPGLAYVRITSPARSQALWLPLFVNDPEGLVELITLHAGEQHPLSKLLRGE